MLPYLEEFAAGIELFQPALPQDSRLDPAHRFFRNSVFQYLDAFYTEGSSGILPVLDSIGRKDLADPLRSALAEPIGGSTIGRILRSWRNKGIAHLTFRAGHFVDALHDADLFNEENAEHFMAHVYFLIHATAGLRDILRTIYPQTIRRPPPQAP
jgi:hypothetical protein